LKVDTKQTPLQREGGSGRGGECGVGRERLTHEERKREREEGEGGRG